MSTDKKLLNSKEIIAYIYLLISSAVILFLATKSSSFYLYNEWCDANSYFTVGKSFFNGLVPYRDVFDQKGMYLYFSYGLCYLISHNTFLGVYFLEVILGLLNLVIMRKIILLFVDDRNNTSRLLATILPPIVLAIIFSSYSFYMGGSAEELCLPLYFGGLYLILRYVKNRENQSENSIDKKTLIIGGILAGLVANIKFTGLGFFFAWMAWLFFDLLIQKKVAEAFKACLWFLLGMLIPFIPWLIYFGIQGELYSWYWGYVWVNVFSYSDFSEGIGLSERIYNLAKIALWTFQQNPAIFTLGYIGILLTIFRKGLQLWDRFLVPLLFGLMFLGIYVGGSFLPYYALPLSVFTVLGASFIATGLTKLTTKHGHNTKQAKASSKPVLNIILMVCSLAVGILLVYFTSMNISDHNISKEDHYLTQMSEIINDSGIEKPTLLTVNRLDCGLYTTCDIIPNIRWFQTQTFNNSLPFDEQQRYIKEGIVDFVFVQDSIPEYIYDNYVQVFETPWYSEKTDKMYYLFQKR